MTSKIRVLDEDTINKIAAGEVIENPSSVVKELVENSLDASATEIVIEIKGGGRQLIRITDNGTGMSNDDALLCLERHATSKIKEIDHLHQIGTMGFRGEAIPSIASISKFTLYTRLNSNEASNSAGTLIIVNGGKLLTCSEVECAAGTTIEIKDLFFNVPVRKKFQKSPNYDTTEIQRIVTQLALGNPKVTFQLISNHELLISTKPISEELSHSEALFERISQLLGDEIASSMHPISGHFGDYDLKGYIGAPSTHRHNRSLQYLFINRRGISSSLVSFAVRDGYGTMLPTGRHPIYVLHLTMAPDLLDVNVHPQKREVRLCQENQLKEMIITSVEKALQQKNFFQEAPHVSCEEFPIDMPNVASFKGDYSDKFSPWQGHHIDPFTRPDDAPIYNKPLFDKVNLSPAPVDSKAPLPVPNQPLLFNLDKQPPDEVKPLVEPLKAIGLIQKYIIAIEERAHSSELYLIDQRAAHARVIFEKLISQEEGCQLELQMLLIPHLLELSTLEATSLSSQLSSLSKAGIHIKEFGATSFVIEALPEIFGNVDIHKLIDEIVKCSYEGIESSAFENEQKRRLATFASRSAVSADRRLTLIEAQELLNQLAQCKNPKQCPNGKSTQTSLTVGDIEKRLNTQVRGSL